MPNLQVILRTKGKEPALLPELCRRPKAEESRRAPAQETSGKALVILWQTEKQCLCHAF